MSFAQSVSVWRIVLRGGLNHTLLHVMLLNLVDAAVMAETCEGNHLLNLDFAWGPMMITTSNDLLIITTTEEISSRQAILLFTRVLLLLLVSVHRDATADWIGDVAFLSNLHGRPYGIAVCAPCHYVPSSTSTTSHVLFSTAFLMRVTAVVFKVM